MKSDLIRLVAAGVSRVSSWDAFVSLWKEGYPLGPRWRFLGLAVALLWVVGLAGVPAGERVYFNGADHRDGYYVLPDKVPGDGRKLWVVVDVHGAGGLTSDSSGPDLALLLEPEPVIVLVPSFSNGYQAGDGDWAAQLIGNFRMIARNHSVHGRMFLHGHSGGAQFVHRFAFAYPCHVVGVSAHSAGSWAVAGGYGRINDTARQIPFLISCGEEDTARSVPNSPHTRIEWYQLFAEEMRRRNFVIRAETWPGVGHNLTARHYGPGLRECFLLATRGELPRSGRWTGDVEGLAEKVKQ